MGLLHKWRWPGTARAEILQPCCEMSRIGGPRLSHQLLLYPVLDCDFDKPSYKEFASGFFLTGEMMRWFWRQYLSKGQAAADWRVSPFRQISLSNLPSATIFTAEYDVLGDEAEYYAMSLKDAGVPTTLKCWEGAHSRIPSAARNHRRCRGRPAGSGTGVTGGVFQSLPGKPARRRS